MGAHREGRGRFKDGARHGQQRIVSSLKGDPWFRHCSGLWCLQARAFLLPIDVVDNLMGVWWLLALFGWNHGGQTRSNLGSVTTGRPCHFLEILGRAGSTPARQGCGENACVCGANIRSRIQKRYLSQRRQSGHMRGRIGWFLGQTWASRSWELRYYFWLQLLCQVCERPIGKAPLFVARCCSSSPSFSADFPVDLCHACPSDPPLAGPEGP